MIRFALLLALFAPCTALPGAPAAAGLEAHAQSARRLLKNVEGVTVSVEGAHVVIDGDVLTREDMDRVVKVAALFPDAVSLVTLHPQVPVSRSEQMERAIHQNSALDAVYVEFHNDTFLLQGAVYSEADRKNAEEIAVTYLPELMQSEAVKQGVLTSPLKKYAIRNLIQIVKRPRR